VSIFRSKKRARRKQKPGEVDPDTDEGIIGLYDSILATVEEEFTKAVSIHLEHLHQPGGYAREKQQHDFMDLGMRRSYIDALDDIEFTIEDTMCLPQLQMRKRGMAVLVTRWTVRGVHNRPLAGVAPSGDQITIEGMTYSTFRNYNVRVEYTFWHMPELTRRMVGQ
jgi:hypothetical protein